MLLVELIVTFIFLIISADLISRGTEKLEAMLGQGLAGGIVMGFLTALPETVFVIVASLKGEPYIALGSAIGGNVLLFTLGVGILGIYFYLRWRKSLKINEEYSVEHKFLIITTFALLLILLYGRLNLFVSIPLLAIYIYYATYRVRKFINENRDIDEREIIKASFFLTAGTIILIIFSEPFVQDIATLSEILGVPAIWLALIITPLAGELEETISAIRLTHTSDSGGSLAIFDFVGSKIQNATVLLALIGFFNDISLTPSLSEMLATVIANVIAIMILMDKNLGLRESLVLLFLYFGLATMTLYF